MPFMRVKFDKRVGIVGSANAHAVCWILLQCVTCGELSTYVYIQRCNKELDCPNDAALLAQPCSRLSRCLGRRCSMKPTCPTPVPV